MRTSSQRLRIRIYLEDSDRWQGRPLYHVLIEAARQDGLAVAMALKGVFGYGCKTHQNAGKMLREEGNPPVIIEIVDEEPIAREFLKRMDEYLREAMVTIEPIETIHYRMD
ncbi:MAG: DUF190 domain-containing protein [Elusimicrobiota bacterium]|jgi:hypothetical protein